MELDGWKVMLMGIDLASTDMTQFTADDAAENTTPVVPGDQVFGDIMTDTCQDAGMTTATIGGHSLAGNWQGSFHGNGRDDNQPGSVVGTFDADNASVGISGAFGAHNVSPDN